MLSPEAFDLALGKHCTIDFCMLKNQELPPLSDRLQKEWVENCCDGGLVILESFYKRKEELD